MISSTYRPHCHTHIITHIILHRNNAPDPPSRPQAWNLPQGTQTKFADQLSGTRYFSVTLSTIEGHLAAAG
jgi:hypothetical protein